VNEENMEDELAALRQAEAIRAVGRMRAQAREKGLDKLGFEEIDRVISKSRKERKKMAAAK